MKIIGDDMLFLSSHSILKDMFNSNLLAYIQFLTKVYQEDTKL